MTILTLQIVHKMAKKQPKTAHFLFGTPFSVTKEPKNRKIRGRCKSAPWCKNAPNGSTGADLHHDFGWVQNCTRVSTVQICTTDLRHRWHKRGWGWVRFELKVSAVDELDMEKIPGAVLESRGAKIIRASSRHMVDPEGRVYWQDHAGNWFEKVRFRIDNDDYTIVRISKWVGEQQRKLEIKLHHLVLDTFVGPPPDGMWGLHNDDDRRNNRLTNLRWGTPKENAADRDRNRRNQKFAKQDPFSCRWYSRKA